MLFTSRSKRIPRVSCFRACLQYQSKIVLCGMGFSLTPSLAHFGWFHLPVYTSHKPRNAANQKLPMRRKTSRSLR